MIPNAIYQCWNSTRIPETILKKTLQNIPNNCKHVLFTVEEARNYMKKRGDVYLELFDAYDKIPHKVDLWRYCILYDKGGMYLDADCVLLSSLHSLMNYGCFFVTNDRGEKNIFNGFFGTRPKNPILKEMIDFMVNTGTKFKDYYYNCIHLYKVIKKAKVQVKILYDTKINNRFYVKHDGKLLLVESNALYPYK